MVMLRFVIHCVYDENSQQLVLLYHSDYSPHAFWYDDRGLFVGRNIGHSDHIWKEIAHYDKNMKVAHQLKFDLNYSG